MDMASSAQEICSKRVPAVVCKETFKRSVLTLLRNKKFIVALAFALIVTSFLAASLT